MTQRSKNTHTDRNGYASGAASDSIVRFLAKHPGWETVSEHGTEKLRKQYEFSGFDAAIAFAEALLYLGKAEGHHPVIRLERNTMRAFITWWTKEINGIHHRDLTMAQETDRIFDLGSVNVWSNATAVTHRNV
jgi:4a-hydroxytetrahydrobiopterin dehydratase